ncbi:MAG: ATP-binding protein, partial [Sciscionella sp.]
MPPALLSGGGIPSIGGVAVRWPLTGRANELAFIAELTRGGDGPVGVVLSGAAGVGKTRLAREVLSAVEQRGALAQWAVATASARALPLGAFAGLV